MGLPFALCFTTLLFMSGVEKALTSVGLELEFINETAAPSPPSTFYSAQGRSQLEPLSDAGSSQSLSLPGPFKYFGSSHGTIYIHEDGFLSFSDVSVTSNPNPDAQKDIIAPLWTDLNMTSGGQIFYGNVTNGPLLSQAKEDINRMFPDEYFDASWLFFVTWEQVPLANNTGVVTFQVVLATDGDLSYVLMNYGDIAPNDQPWLAGYMTEDQGHNYIGLQNAFGLSSSSNVGVNGRWGFRVNGGQIATCETLKCTENEVCAQRTGVFGCKCARNNSRPNPKTFDATETCASSSGSVSLSRCQLFESGFPSEFLHLNDPSCRGVTHGDKVEFYFDNDENICGTKLKSNKTHFIYENSIQMILEPKPRRVISRKSWLNITFSCVYPLVQSISMPMSIEAKGSVVSKELSTEGVYSIYMMPYPNSSFIAPYSGNVTLDVNQQVYVAVEVNGVDGRQIATVLDNCWATPVEDGNSSVRWDLIKDECPSPKDGTVHLYKNGNGTSSQFSFQMFTFTGVSENIYVHCQVHLCLLKGGDCAQPCDDSRARSRRSLDFHDTAAITMGF